MLAHSYIVWWAAQVVAVAILVYLFLRWRPGFTGKKTVGETLAGALDYREGQIRAQLEAAQQSRDEAAQIHEQSQRDLDRARQEADTIVSRAAQTSEAIKRDIESKARQEYERIVGQARSQIDYEREQAEMALRRRAADIVVDAARQVVRENLDAQSDRRLITDSLDNLERIG